MNPSSVEVDSVGGVLEISITCSTGYHIDSMPSWVSDVSDPDAIQVHRFKVAENPTEDERSGVIVFCDDAGSCLPCSVKQKGRIPDQKEGDNEDFTEGDPIKW